MRFSAHVFLTGVIFLAYIIGGLTVPVAHHHHHDNCCSVHEVAAVHKQECSHSSCPFGHVNCGHANCGHANCGHSSSEKPASKDSVPTAPHKDCAACRLLYMATTAVEFVSLPMCEAVVAEVSVQHVASALTGDIAFPAQRGPPVCV